MQNRINVIIQFDNHKYTPQEELELKAKFFMTLAQLKRESESKANG